MAKFKKQFLLTCLILALCFGLPSYAQTEQWRVTYDFSIVFGANVYLAQDIGQQIGLDDAGNVYVVVSSKQWGSMASYNPAEHKIFKYDADGNKQWDRGGFYGRLKDFHVDPQGNAYILYAHDTTIQSGEGNRFDTVIGKINSNGTLAWWESWNNATDNNNDWPVAMDVDSSGNVYVLIKSDFNPPPSTYSYYRPVIQKYSPTGNLLWQVIGTGGSVDIDTDNAGNAYVLQGGIFKKYNSADGTELFSGDVEYWWNDDGLPSNWEGWSEAGGVDIEVAPDGNVYIAAIARQRHWYWVGPDPDDWDSEILDNFFTAKYDSACNLIWSDEYGSYEEEDRPLELVFDDDGNILVTGPSGNQLATLEYSPAGTRVGTYLYSDSDGYEQPPEYDESSGFHVDGTYAYVIEPSPLALHKYSLSTGAEQWNIPLNDLITGNDIVVEPSGNFYLTGSVDDVWTHQPLSAMYRHDMVLIKYSQEAVVVGNTPAGPGVVVAVDGATITFDNVTDSGDTTVTESDTGPPPPANFQTCTPPVYYDITTTATYTGTIEVCLSYDDTVCDEADMHLFHYEGGIWVDVTTSVNTATNIICGEVTSLSAFLLATPIVVEPIPPVANASASPLAGTAPLAVEFTGTGTDADGVIVLYEWDFDGDGTYDWSSTTTGVTDHTYTPPGQYDAVLRVTDNDGDTDTDTVTIDVSPADIPVVVDDLVTILIGRIGYDRRTGQFSVNVTVTNISAVVIGSPVWLVIESISSPSVTVANPDGTTADGKEYLDLSGLLGDGQLDPGESITTRIYFVNPSRALFTFVPSVRGV